MKLQNMVLTLSFVSGSNPKIATGTWWEKKKQYGFKNFCLQQTCMTFPVIHSARPSGISSSTGLRRRTCAVWLFCILATIPAVTVNLPGPECTLTWIRGVTWVLKTRPIKKRTKNKRDKRGAQFRWTEIVGDPWAGEYYEYQH